MNASLIDALVALQSVAGLLPPTDAPTFEEASKLPARQVIAKATGPLQSLFVEMQRPYQGGLPPVTSYNLRLAMAPARTSTPGLCVAQIIDLTYWSASKISESLWAHRVVLKRLRTDRKYSFRPFIGKPVDEDCADASHIFSDPNRDFTPQSNELENSEPPEFFEFGSEVGDADAAAGFAVRSIGQAIEKCGETLQRCGADKTIIVPVRFRSLDSVVVDDCEVRDRTALCLKARFFGSRKTVPGSAPLTLVTIATTARKPTDAKFEILSVRIEPEEVYTH